ncbi:cytochrome p450 [Trifolium pratense]|uniref:Cytochrome p450 n=1 Tax=Trifolium pratense TaxID=57577 RepID=A0A2K3LM22_TRIPR|nr:cytochrome p450 [Trifolium pratense]
MRWERPSMGRYKCNIDVLFSSARNRVGIAMCIRDCEGCFVLAKTMSITPLCNVDKGEALGLLYAINWVHDLQLEGVDFALASKKMVDYFHKGGNVSEFGDVDGWLS